MNQPLVHDLIDAVVQTIGTHAEELTALDRAIGDGDHGINMKRGFDAVLATLPDLATKPLPDALRAAGTTLIMKVGGASGPLFGTLFVQLGKRLPEAPTVADVAAALSGALDAVQTLGKSQPGQKTMLDVLVPVLRALESGPDDVLVRIGPLAHTAADATVPMRAIRGRASFLGDRSIGHMDPGARSSALIVETVATVLQNTCTRGH